MGTLDDAAWPAAFRCTAIDTDTGDLVVSHRTGRPAGGRVRRCDFVPVSDTAREFVKLLTFTGPEEIVDADLT